MLLTQNYRPRNPFQQQPLHPRRTQPIPHQSQFLNPSTSPLTASYDTTSDLDTSLPSLSSSPQSTQSLPSQFSSTAAFDGLPTIAVPRGIQQLQDLDLTYPVTLGGNSDPQLLADFDIMQTDPWFPALSLTPRTIPSRATHQRESSLSSLGSAGPASPYSRNTAHPQIAITDSTGDGFHALPHGDDFHYQFGKSFPASQEAFYANYPNYASVDAAACANMTASHRQKSDRGLLPPDFPSSQTRSRPVSVASSVASDSPATPAGEPEEDKRRKTAAGIQAVPKLDRTMTDIYSDELYSPNFTITSASPSQAPVSPRNELFAQRLQAANSQHLSTSHSPVSGVSRDRSPFRQGSPFAPAMHDFAATAQQILLGAGHQNLREQKLHDVQVQQHLASEPSIGTPQTISPKDAILEYHSPEGEANFPLFPQNEAAAFDAASLKAATQPQQVFNGLPMDDASFATYNQLPQLPVNVHIPQQYPFIAQPHQQSSSLSDSSVESSRLGSTECGQSDSAHDSSIRRPAGTNADGGTYTCTYHGCTQRFETPALLQKHKREGHRQAHGLVGPRRPEPVVTDTTSAAALLNTQAGPHKCERINPSTGKPCNTVFSRPYDLTRHEDTIHNARKQKVRCNLCTDDKSFSRADALTRHYRVCHPDVEFPGKHRRRAVPAA